MRDSVSIVIPCYNHGRFLGEAVDSALAQTTPPSEVIVVDDGSTDSTPEVADGYGDSIRYFRTGNRGQQEARNLALAKAEGDFFINLDADNRLCPEYIERTLGLSKEYDAPDLAFVYTRRLFFGEREGVSGRHEFDPVALKFRNYIDMCSLIKMDVVKRFGFDPAFNSGWQDFDFYLTLVENGYRGKLLDLPLVEYRIHTDSVTGRRKGKYPHLALMRKIVAKHAALYSRRDRRAAMRRAASRVIGSVLNDRVAGVPFSRRCRALAAMAAARPTPVQLAGQIMYTLWPGIML